MQLFIHQGTHIVQFFVVILTDGIQLPFHRLADRLQAACSLLRVGGKPVFKQQQFILQVFAVAFGLPALVFHLVFAQRQYILLQ